jgi:hypothetical protein
MVGTGASREQAMADFKAAWERAADQMAASDPQ